MKSFYSILLLLLGGILPLQAEASQPAEQHLKEIVERTFLQDQEMKELFYMIASKKIADSGKSIDPEELMKTLKTELEKPENLKKFEQPYLARFNEKEIAEIHAIVEKPVFEKYSKAAPEIIRESVKELDKILDAMIGKTESKPLGKAGSIVEVTEENFEQEVIQSTLPVVLDFYAEWCAPCKGMQPILQALSQKYEGKVKFTKLDIDKAKSIAEKFKVKDLPVVIFIKEGKIAEVHSGFADTQTFDEKIRKFLL